MSSSLFTGLKELSERGGIGLIGAQLDGVDIGGTEESQDIGLGF